ncbi:putative DNA helicase [Metarhizium anisopliae]
MMKRLATQDCAILIGGIDGSIFAGKELGISDIGSHLIAKNIPDKTAWLGFDIHFPFGEENEENGFGMCYSWSDSEGIAVPAKTYAITVKFPRHNVVCTIRPANASTRSRFPDETRELSLVEVVLEDKAQVIIEGYGMPYANRGHIAEKWLRENTPLINDVTLTGLLAQRSYHFVVASEHSKLSEDWSFDLLPPPFNYPYGTDHTWKSQSEYAAMLRNSRGHQFFPRTSFDNINELLTVLSQSQIQDVFWLEAEAEKMRKTKVPAYFIPKAMDYDGEKEHNLYYAIVALPPEYRTTFESAWRRLAKEGTLKIFLHRPSEDSAGHWDAYIVDTPSARYVLEQHPTETHELVLCVRRPPRYHKRSGPDFRVWGFGNRSIADAALEESKKLWNCISLDFSTNLKDFERKISEGSCLFGPCAEPSNLAVLGLTEEMREKNPAACKEIVRRGIFRMHVQKDLLLGTGFYNTLRAKPQSTGGEIETALADLRINGASRGTKFWRLPGQPLLDVSDRDFVDALMQEALPEDRSRFTEYLRNRPLGLGIIIAPPGFGKTTALAVGALAMAQTLGKLFLSGPTHVSVDNAAARLDVISGRVTKRLNDKLGQQDESPKYRRKLIIRAYKIGDELTAFKNLLRNPGDADKAAPTSEWSVDSKWKLHLSLAYWVLVVLRAPTVRQLGPDDKADLLEIRDRYDEDEMFDRLRAIATGAIDWADYKRGTMATDDEIKGIMTAIINVADVIETTPYQACKEPFCEWKKEQARGFVFDEAGNMNRPDLLCVWGNTCQPCLLAGDEKQLPPTVMTKLERDGEGNFLNRFAGDGAISPIQHFKSMGWPVYRLRVQLRMAVGQFDLTYNQVYKDIPFTYGPGCDISLPQHHIGRQLELYLGIKFPDLTSAPAGELHPVFVHCMGSQASRDKFSGSTRNPDQVKIGLNLLVDFVEAFDVRPQDIVIISPYSANISTIEKFRKRPKFASLKPMRPAATVDSFQGQEGDIVMIIMGTTTSTGPGFTSDEHRLNVLLSRHRSGLIIVGDINVTGNVKNHETPFKGVNIIGKTGEKFFDKCNMLRNVHVDLHSAGRVVRVAAYDIKGTFEDDDDLLARLKARRKPPKGHPTGWHDAVVSRCV